jgi:hypothetical protein
MMKNILGHSLFSVFIAHCFLFASFVFCSDPVPKNIAEAVQKGESTIDTIQYDPDDYISISKYRNPLSAVAQFYSQNSGQHVDEKKKFYDAVYITFGIEDPEKESPMGFYAHQIFFTQDSIDDTLLKTLDDKNKTHIRKDFGDNIVGKCVQDYGSRIQVPALYQAYRLDTNRQGINLCAWYATFFVNKMLAVTDIEDIKNRVNDRSQFDIFFEEVKKKVAEGRRSDAGNKTISDFISGQTSFVQLHENALIVSAGFGQGYTFCSAKNADDLFVYTPDKNKLGFIIRTGTIGDGTGVSHWIAAVAERKDGDRIEMIVADSFGVDRTVEDPGVQAAYNWFLGNVSKAMPHGVINQVAGIPSYDEVKVSSKSDYKWKSVFLANCFFVSQDWDEFKNKILESKQCKDFADTFSQPGTGVAIAQNVGLNLIVDGFSAFSWEVGGGIDFGKISWVSKSVPADIFQYRQFTDETRPFVFNDTCTQLVFMIETTVETDRTGGEHWIAAKIELKPDGTIEMTVADELNKNRKSDEGVVAVYHWFVENWQRHDPLFALQCKLMDLKSNLKTLKEKLKELAGKLRELKAVLAALSAAGT